MLVSHCLEIFPGPPQIMLFVSYLHALLASLDGSDVAGDTAADDDEVPGVCIEETKVNSHPHNILHQ